MITDQGLIWSVGLRTEHIAIPFSKRREQGTGPCRESLLFSRFILGESGRLTAKVDVLVDAQL